MVKYSGFIFAPWFLARFSLFFQKTSVKITNMLFRCLIFRLKGRYLWVFGCYAGLKFVIYTNNFRLLFRINIQDQRIKMRKYFLGDFCVVFCFYQILSN